MFCFPNQTIVHPDDVLERVKEEFPRQVEEPRPCDRVEEAAQGSFPASDAPAWTISGIGPPRPPAD